MISWIILIAVGLVAGTLSGVVGFGSTTILMPFLVLYFGPKAAVPIIAIASLIGNAGRVLVWWSSIRWGAVAAFSSTALASVWLGARTLLALNPVVLEIGLGVFFIAMIPLRRWFARHDFRVSLSGLACAGAVVGFLTGLVANTGPINAPFFLAHGLVKGPFVGTEALSSLVMYGSKLSAFWTFGALPPDIAVSGAIIGLTLMAGAWIAKGFVLRLDAAIFSVLMEALLLVAGMAMIISALAAT